MEAGAVIPVYYYPPDPSVVLTAPPEEVFAQNFSFMVLVGLILAVLGGAGAWFLSHRRT